MPLEPLQPIDTRPLFRPVSEALVALLRALPSDGWQRPTIAGSWLVRDVVAHMLDTTCRRLSFHRDRMRPPPPTRPIASERDFVQFINQLNATWVAAAQRLSPRVLTDLYERASREAADWYESLPLDHQALFPVSWAGEDASAGWFDLGREFTELWHHQQQVRLATGTPAIEDPRLLAAVIDIAMRGLPHAFGDVTAAEGTAVVIDIAGPAGGQWTLVRGDNAWTLHRGSRESADPDARIGLADEDAWRILFNAVEPAAAATLLDLSGQSAFAEAFLRARSVVV